MLRPPGRGDEPAVGVVRAVSIQIVKGLAPSCPDAAAIRLCSHVGAVTAFTRLHNCCAKPTSRLRCRQLEGSVGSDEQLLV